MNLVPGTKRKPAALGLAACSAAVILAASGSAMAQTCPTTATAAGAVHHIKIYNDTNPPQYIFAAFEPGLDKGADLWMQAICEVPKSKIGTATYRRATIHRFYINPTTGIPPGGSVDITIPLFTQLVTTVDPSEPDQYAEWWQGQNIQLYLSPTSTPPAAYTVDYMSAGGKGPLPNQNPMQTKPNLPTCRGSNCKLVFFDDTGGLPKNDPSQLFEATMGALQYPKIVGDSPPYSLDRANDTMDVSYVDVANNAFTVGPYQNDQVGYVGSPLQPGVFKTKLDQFAKDFDWPYVTETNQPDKPVPKLLGPIDLFATLSGGLPPPDVQPPSTAWPSLWKPLADLNTDWTTNTKSCKHSTSGPATFCDALLDVQEIVHKNYQNYAWLIKHTPACAGQNPVSETDLGNTLSHVYGFTPWVESNNHCIAPEANLLPHTPNVPGSHYPVDKPVAGDYNFDNYAKYAKVKKEFDTLQYNKYASPPYVFNPWVEFIHGKKYLGIDYAYAYSVDDAVGVIQAEGHGYIIDVGGFAHQENPLPAAPPILITVGPGFAYYRLCVNDPYHEKPINELSSAFVLNANNAKTCPVYLIDKKQQTYTFTVDIPAPTTLPPPPLFTVYTPGAQKWIPASQTPNTTSVIDCSGNLSTKPFAPSSKAWCCSITNKRGVFAFSFENTDNVAHKAFDNRVQTLEALNYTQADPMTCSNGK